MTCESPTISYGTYDSTTYPTTYGIPTKHDNNDYDQWCREMGFSGPASVTTISENVIGALFWCYGSDDPEHKWCDVWDNYWKDGTLDYDGEAERITSLTCTDGKKELDFFIIRYRDLVILFLCFLFR